MIKKRLKAIYIITALLCVFVSSLFSFVPVKAYSASATEFTVTSTLGERNSATIEVIMTVNLVDYYTGYINFTLYNPYSAALSYYALNTKITNFGTTSIRCNIEQTKTFEVHIFYDSAKITTGLYNASLISSNSFASASTYVGEHWKTMCDVKTYGTKSLSVDRPSATDTTDLENGVTSIDTNISSISNYVNSISGNVNSINGNVASIIGDIQTISNQLTTLVNSVEKYQDYNIPLYMYSAVLLFDTIYDLEYDTTLSLPRFNVSASSSFNWNSYFKLDSNDIYFVYYMKLNSINNFTYTTYSGNTISKTRNFISETSTYRLYYDILHGGSSTEYLTPTSSSAYQIFPIYLGSLNQMPSEVREILNVETKTNGLISTIINLLNNGNNETVSNLETATDDIINETNTVSTLTNTYDTQITEGTTNITNAINNIDLGGLAQAGVFVANVMQSLYNNMGDYKILVTIPLVVGILLLIINKPRLFEPSETERSNTLSWHDSNGNVHQTQRFTVTKKTYGRRESSTYWRRLDD